MSAEKRTRFLGNTDPVRCDRVREMKQLNTLAGRDDGTERDSRQIERHWPGVKSFSVSLAAYTDAESRQRERERERTEKSETNEITLSRDDDGVCQRSRSSRLRR